MDISYGPGTLAASCVPHGFSNDCISTPEKQALSGSFAREGKDEEAAYLLVPLLLSSLPVLRPWSVRWHLRQRDRAVSVSNGI